MTPNGTKKRVLLVEDNPINMELAVVLLSGGGYEILQATTAEAAIGLATQEHPDLILMDIGLPGMDGLEATRQLTQAPETMDIPIVALTAQAMEGERDKALASGCSGYIAKPIDTRAFAQIVARLLADEEN